MGLRKVRTTVRNARLIRPARHDGVDDVRCADGPETRCSWHRARSRRESQKEASRTDDHRDRWTWRDHHRRCLARRFEVVIAAR